MNKLCSDIHEMKVEIAYKIFKSKKLNISTDEIRKLFNENRDYILIKLLLSVSLKIRGQRELKFLND